MSKDAKYLVTLSVEEREELQRLVDRERLSKTVRQRARVLLKADQSDGAPAWPDERVAEFAEVSLSTVHRTRERFVTQGLEAALHRKRRPQPRKLDGRSEAKLIAVACGKPPDGCARWTMRLLAGRLVELEVVESISHECVRQTLKKTRSSRICGSSG
jgi:transposase